MPSIGFKAENKKQNPEDFPRLKLKNNEHARIVILQDPEFQYLHTLRAPKIVNGAAVTEKGKRKDGTEYDTFAQDFIGQPRCLGDLEVLEKKGSDPGNCPVCAMASTSPMAKPPERRFALHIAHYATNPNSFVLQNPFQLQIKVWAFTERMYGQLIDIAQEHGSLMDRDLLLGPCKSETYQNYEIKAAAEAAWKQPDAELEKFGRSRADMLKVAFEHNHAEDINVFLGRAVSRTWVEEDLEKVRGRWAIANGTQPEPVTAGSSVGGGDLGGELAGLLNTTPSATQPEPATGLSFAELMNSPASPPAPQSPGTDEFKAGTTSNPGATTPAAVSSFDDLLGLGAQSGGS